MKLKARHLTFRQIVLARDKALPEGRIAQHLAVCPDCQARLREACRLAQLLRSTLAETDDTETGLDTRDE